MKRKEKNRAKTIKITVLLLFFILIILWIACSIFFIYIFADFNEMDREEILKIFNSKPFIVYLCTIFLVWSLVFCKIILTIMLLDDCAVLNSEDINKMIAKNTAPLREKYYLLYNTTKQKEKKLTLLRKYLEKIFYIVNQKKIIDRLGEQYDEN